MSFKGIKSFSNLDRIWVNGNAWCSKIIEGESFVDLVIVSYNNARPHAWKNIAPVEEEIHNTIEYSNSSQN